MFRKPCGSGTTILTLLTFVFLCIIGVQESTSIAIAPSTFGTAIARAGKISNSLKFWFTGCCFSIKDLISPKTPDLIFKLKTSCTEDAFDLGQLEDIVTSKSFDFNKPLVIYFSGFLIGLPGTGVEVVTRAYHCRNDTNFVFADSLNLLNTILRWSIFNTEELGQIIGKGLVKLVKEKLYPPDKIHIIGHSLGAHIAGNVGRYFKEITGKSILCITALDPANGCSFGGENSCLQLTDADFIDVIHTNPGGFGTKDHLGHVDFYVGGLSSLQSGCWLLGCSHIRACDYYAETVYPGNENNFLAFHCDSGNNINANSCQGKPLQAMGYKVSSQAKGIYYLEVNSKSPYGKNAANNDFVTSECNLCKNE